MAIPFRIVSDPEPPIVHYMVVQNLLRELLTVLSRMPSVIARDRSASSYSFGPPLLPGGSHERLLAQQQQNSALAFNRRRSRERQQQREPQQGEQQQRPSLPDLVTSANPSLQPRSPRSPRSPRPSPRPQQQFAAGGGDDDDVEGRIAGAVLLQVAVCPDCYNRKDRKLKVIAVAKLDENGNPIRWTCNRDDEEPVVVENKSSKVKQRIMSLFQPAKIESSVLTAMFVIIGWKMFIRQ